MRETGTKRRAAARRWLAPAAALLAVMVAVAPTVSSEELSHTGQFLDGVAAVVNDGVVLKSELAQQMQAVTQRLRQQNTPLPPQSVLRDQILERLIVNRIELQRAKRLGIQISDDQLNRALAQVANRNGLTLDQLPDTLASQGIDYNAYRDDLRQQLVLDQLRQRDVVSGIQVSQREIDQFLSKQSESAAEDVDYNISHILISVPSAATRQQVADAQKRAEDIYRQLENGADFAQLAVANSDAQTALDGGSLGWRKGSELPTIFADVVPQMKTGEVSKPIRAASGFHIVKLNQVRGAEKVIVDQVHVRHILMTTNEILDDDTVRQRLEDIRQEILNGQDFGAIATAVSEDVVSGAKGGDLGWAQPGDFDPAFEKEIDQLKIGEISEPFKTPYGWHIAQVLERRKYDTTEESRRRQAIASIRARKLEEETELWLRRLRDEAYVDIRI